MLMKFTLRSAYADLNGGTINTGDGSVVNVVEEMTDGVISTDNPNKQQALGGYRGAHGFVFDAVVVDSDGTEVEVEREEQPEQRPTRTPAEAVEAMEGEGSAVHGSVEGYALLSQEELSSIARERGLRVKSNATKDQLVEIIEESDAAEALDQKDA